MTKKKKELTDAELDALDSFLQYEFNYDIYQELTDKDDDYFELFEPLEFFRILYEQTAFIEENKNKPLSVARSLKKLSLSDNQFYYLYRILLLHFSDDKEKDEQINVCYREIYKLQYNLDVYEDDVDEEKHETALAEKIDKFQELLKYLETLSNSKDKIAYLVKEKTKAAQNKSGLSLSWGNELSFSEKCQLEIEKLKELTILEESQKDSKDGIKKHKDITLDRAVLALSYLLDELNVKCPLSKKKEFIDFITPYSPNTIKTKLENLHEKQEKNFVEYEKDLQVISRYFENLGLLKIVEQIKADLEFE